MAARAAARHGARRTVESGGRAWTWTGLGTQTEGRSPVFAARIEGDGISEPIISRERYYPPVDVERAIWSAGLEPLATLGMQEVEGEIRLNRAVDEDGTTSSCASRPPVLSQVQPRIDLLPNVMGPLKLPRETDVERLMSEARDEIVALLEEEGPLVRGELKPRLAVQVTEDQIVRCLMYLCVEERVERPTGLRYRATGAVGFSGAL